MSDKKDAKDVKETKTVVCVICRKDSLQSAPESKIPTLKDMTKIDRVTPWNGKTVYCWVFDNPKDPYDNKYASAVMGMPIKGNAILGSNKGMDVDEVEEFAEKPVQSWASMAKQMPKYMKHDPKKPEKQPEKSQPDYGDEDDESDDNGYDEPEPVDDNEFNG